MWGLGPISYGQVAAAIYLKVSLSDFLTLFSARTTSFFFTIKPDIKLVFAAFAALGASTVLTSQWPTALNEKKLEEKYMEPAAFADNSEYKRIYDLSGTRMNGTPDDVLGVTWLYCVSAWERAGGEEGAGRRSGSAPV